MRAHGRVGQAQIGSAAHSPKRIRKNAARQKKPPNFSKLQLQVGGIPPRPPFRPPENLMVFFVKKGSNFFVITAQNRKLGIFRDDFPRIFPQPNHFLPREAEVRHAKACSAE